MNKNKLYGAILGDLAGQPYEYKYRGDFSEFKIHDERSTITDDTIMTLATAFALLENKDFETCYKVFGLKYYGDFYGTNFKEWLNTPLGTISNSFGNGCLMRLSPIFYINYPDQIKLVIESCMTSHFHPRSVYRCLGLYWLDDLVVGHNLRHSKVFGIDKNKVLKKFEKVESDVDSTMNFIGSLFWIDDSTTRIIERVVKCGGDTDTNASIAGELFNRAFDDLTKDDIDYVESKLDPYLLGILHKFNKVFND